ncbi:MAG TPA: IPT/TIG domain-containing protein [Pyrinomonadaceae bacterium]|nr:IPT/TIG domain-containing protein [Pyrinomonadaceae bacterium]
MALFEGKTPAERNKMIAAIAFGALALFLVGRMFFGGSETPVRPASNRNSKAITTTGGATANGANGGSQGVAVDPTLKVPRELVYDINPANYSVPDAGRNIFAFYVAPTPKPAPSVVVETPTPTPAPPPPLTLSAISPSNVFARTGDFTLQVSGDKFTPQARVYVDGQELPTQFASAQQLSTTVPAALIAAPGARQIVVRTPDNTLYSNDTSLSVSAPPTPPFTYIGILGSTRYNDKAILKDQKNELVTVQRGDLVGGRFKVTNISTRAVELTDAQLQIKHNLPYSDKGGAGANSPNNPSSRFPAQPPKPPDDDSDDDEPQD